jgi:RNA polymerase primary sigma factor
MSKENDIKSDYLQSLYGIEPLSTVEEHELARRIHEGDDQALEKLVRHNLRFVPHVVTKMSAWAHGKTPEEDLLAIGNEMLLMAARKWKPHKNIPFAGYARPFIELGLKRELNNTANIIRLPVNICLDIKRMNFNEQALTQILGRKPTTPELAKLLGVKKERVHQLKAYISREPISLDNLEQDKHFEENDE